jgi:hypothetical protein
LSEKCSKLDRDDKLNISLDNGPVNLLFEKSTAVISSRLPRPVGRGPSKLLSITERISSLVKFPSKAGNYPDN